MRFHNFKSRKNRALSRIYVTVGASADSRKDTRHKSCIIPSERNTDTTGPSILSIPPISTRTIRPPSYHRGGGRPIQGLLTKDGLLHLACPALLPMEQMIKSMIVLHSPIGTVISPTLISPKRYKWLHDAYSRVKKPEDFPQDLLKLLSC
jgi:hypothetical protein